MAKNRKLSKRQLAVIDDLFKCEIEEHEVLEKHKVSRRTLEEWQNNPAFIERLDKLMKAAHHRSYILLASYAPVAASKLVALTSCEKEETARKACLDIISMKNTPDTKPTQENKQEPTNPPEMPPISQATASKLLAVLAEDTESPETNTEP